MLKNNLSQTKIPLRQKTILIIFGLFLFLVLLEIGLRLGGFVLLSLQEERNAVALRQRGAYRIMCLGESTTALGGRDSYPSQLEEVLNEHNIGIKFRVINKGTPWTNTSVIVSLLEDNLNKYQPDMVIAMMGINDLGASVPYKDIALYKPKETKRYTKLSPRLSIRGLKENYPAQRDATQVEESFKKAIELNPKNAEAYAGLGGLYREQGKYVQAEESFQKAIELNPRNVRAYAGLGWLYTEQGKYVLAEELFQKAIELTPQNTWAYAGLGWSYIAQGKYVLAEELFQKAIELNPGKDRLYAGLAVVYKEMGKDVLAEEYYKKANDLRWEYYNPITYYNYQRLKETLDQKGIKLVCVQYPIRSIEPLKKIFAKPEGIIFVDNERVFKEALKDASYREYFSDIFGGDFGHCTPKGNRLLAENIATVILKEYFNQ